MTWYPRYAQHKANATRRGIVFLLSFDEWLRIWTESSHLHERGPKKHQYVMARNGDCGPYAVGNVKILRWDENRAEQRCGAETRAKMGKSRTGNKNSLGRRESAETRLKKSVALRGNKNSLGHKHPPEECAKQKDRMLKLWANQAFRAKTLAARGIPIR